MNKTRKWLSVILAAVVVLQTGAFAVFGESTEPDNKIITISNIDTPQLTGELSESSVEIETEGFDSKGIKVVSMEFTEPDEFVISGTDISVKNGKYSYRLVIRSDRTIAFDNDLEVYYQGINGKIRLRYEIDKTDNHIITVTGVMENIILASPLQYILTESDREWILAHISEDSYFYELMLKTKEGFTFTNILRFLKDAEKHGYSLNYSCDFLTGEQTLLISGIPDSETAGTDTIIETDTVIGTDTITDSDTVTEKPVSVTELKANALKVSGKTVKLSSKKLKNKNITVARRKAVSVSKAGGNVTYQLKKVTVKNKNNKFVKSAKAAKKISVNKKSGTVTVMKGLKKGEYKVTVNVNAAGNSVYEPITKAVTFRIIVE